MLMLIELVEIFTPDLDHLTAYYRDVLKLPVVSHQSGEHLEIQAGRTRLWFRQQPGSPGLNPAGYYHFAFDIPENQFSEAFHWLEQRTQLAANASGQVRFHSERWNADSVYFQDPDGNILELIARHNQPNHSRETFSAQSLLSLSEFGLASQDVQKTVADLEDQLSVQPYDGAGSQEFTAVGDELGLLIVVRCERVWMPDTGKPADYIPFRLQVRSGQGRGFQLTAPEYPFEFQPA